MKSKSQQRREKIQKSSPKNKAFVGFLLDETGSMTSVLQATVSGFNEYIQTLKNKKEDMRFVLARFNSSKFQTTAASDISVVQELKDYSPNNGTPLYDSIAKFVKQVETTEDKDSKKLMVIMTDGEENESKEFDRAKILDLIKGKEKDGWTFAYLGANQDAWQAGGRMGFSQANTANFTADAAGMKTAFFAAQSATMAFSANTRSGDFKANDKLFNVKHVDDLGKESK